MDYCGPRGLRLSEFDDWPEIDRAMALAWQRRQGEVCPKCHIHPEVTDPELGGDPNALRLRPVLCRPCEIAENDSDRFSKERFPGERQVWQSTPPSPPTP